MTMNTLGLGLGARPARSAKKASFTAPPLLASPASRSARPSRPRLAAWSPWPRAPSPSWRLPSRASRTTSPPAAPCTSTTSSRASPPSPWYVFQSFQSSVCRPSRNEPTRSGVRRVARDPAREREKLCAPPFEFGRRPRDTSSRSSRGAPARGSRDDDARTTSLVPFFSNVLPRGPCWVIHRGFFLEQDARRTFCTSQLAEPFICEGTETDARRDAATDQKTDRSVFSSPLVPSHRRRPSSSCSSPRSPPRSRSARCSRRRRRACSARLR